MPEFTNLVTVTQDTGGQELQEIKKLKKLQSLHTSPNLNMTKSKYKDRAYITRTEWTEHFGGKKEQKGMKASFKSLPFHCCALSLQPFKEPYATPDGYVFDLASIVPYIRKYKTHPVTGEPLSFKQLFKLNLFKNSKEEYHCPVTYKVFNDHTHIVAIRTSGNVYDYDAVKDFNIKLGNMHDLMTNVPFNKDDVIVLQDPLRLDTRNYDDFDHVKRKLVAATEDKTALRDAGINSTLSMRRIMDEMKGKGVYDATILPGGASTKAPPKPADKKAEKVEGQRYSTFHVAASFTNTAMDPVTVQTGLSEPDDPRIKEKKIRARQMREKGYVTLDTSLGAVNLELFCPDVPLACENFLTLCSRGYYTNTVFHRSIRNFMIQGGDPKGTGKGGKSIWDQPFRDEFRNHLKHEGKGVLSMANSGRDTNGSQFFITYKSAPHLDGKHTVFGRVVGGLDVVTAMEQNATDKKDRPVPPIRLMGTSVLVNPYVKKEEVIEEEEEEIEPPVAAGVGVGKYLKRGELEASTDQPPSKKVKKAFGDFSSW